ncbi:peroxidase 43 isoform X1 [Cannabis sativa]|nr:peroxidase 43 isoform X1 [Cannabis sativa]
MSLILGLFFSQILLITTSNAQLRVGFYGGSCPAAEAIVRTVVRNAVVANPNTAAKLLRLHFHDCFVQGCDGSILIESVPNAEKDAFQHQGVGGFEVIDTAKRELEVICPGVVSCADIVALAARDAITLARGPVYEVPTGRRDGRISNLLLASDMPEVSDSIQLIKAKFLRKGLTDRDLVVLTAAHTIGTTACFFMTKRLYNFFPRGGGSDPAINPSFLPVLRARCPLNGDVNARLPIDQGSEQTFDIHIMQNIMNGFAVLESDARLRDDVTTRTVMDSYLGLFNNPLFNRPFFQSDFADSMVKMGQIGVKTGFQGEIRRTCSRFN